MKKTEAQFLAEYGYLSVNALVRYLANYAPLKAVSYPTLRRYIDRGDFEVVEVGGRYRVLKNSIDAYCGFSLPRKPHLGQVGQRGDDGLTNPPPAVVPFELNDNKNAVEPESESESTIAPTPPVQAPVKAEIVDRLDDVTTIRTPLGVLLSIPDVPDTKVKKEEGGSHEGE
jgi:hypothetical protein